MLWETWADMRADVTGLGEAIEDLSGEEADKLAEEHFPDIFKADDWEADAKALFEPRAAQGAVPRQVPQRHGVRQAHRQPLQRHRQVPL